MLSCCFWILSKLFQSFIKLGFRVVNAFNRIYLRIHESVWDQRVAAKEGCFQHGDPERLVQRGADHHIRGPKDVVVLVFAQGKPKVSYVIFQSWSCFFKDWRYSGVGFSENWDLKLKAVGLEPVERLEECFGVLVVLPPCDRYIYNIYLSQQ